MGYSVGDKVEWKDFSTGKSYTCYLMAICPQVPPHKRYTLPNQGDKHPVWEVRRTRKSHLGLISESEIIRKISSNFEGFIIK
ncbi:unnamed protein product [marine sediment metagenome]|uniref:Uncharacterized protein n=1 Tax=marine sediment metagenome TaxID=412755 RepID=X1ADS8_9ZZZZ